MSKNCFIITSSIEVDNNYPLDLWNDRRVRSDFCNEERYRQLCYTLFNLRNIDRDAKIYVIDTSFDYEKYYSLESLYSNITYYPLAKHNQGAALITNINNNKSYCEALLLHSFVSANLEELSQYDFIIKMSGRYSFEMNVNDLQKDKIMFVRKYERQNNPENIYYIIPSTIYALDTKFLNLYVDILHKICGVLGENDETYAIYSMETMLYDYTKEYEEDIVYTGWITRGFSGISKGYIWY